MPFDPKAFARSLQIGPVNIEDKLVTAVQCGYDAGYNAAREEAAAKPAPPTDRHAAFVERMANIQWVHYMDNSCSYAQATRSALEKCGVLALIEFAEEDARLCPAEDAFGGSMYKHCANRDAALKVVRDEA